MALTLQCFEPQARPSRVAIRLEAGEIFAVLLLQESTNGGAPAESSAQLRQTVLRRADEAPPPGATLLLEAEIREGRPGDPRVLRARNVPGAVKLEILRPDVRSIATMGSEWRSGTRLEASLDDLSSVVFTLEVQAEVAQGARAGVGAGRLRRADQVESAMSSAFWIIPTAAATLADPKARAMTWIATQAKKAGISPALFSPLLFMSGIGVGLGFLAYREYSKAQEAEEKAAIAEERAMAAEAGRDAALVAEAACVEERKELAGELDDQDTTRALQAEIALSAPLSQAVAVEMGGARMGTAEALTFDQQATDNAKKHAATEMAKLRDAPENTERCLGLAEILGQDLPPYVLLWHPDPELVCPDKYAVVDAGVDRMGAWGLSKRASLVFGSSDGAPGGGADPRVNDRWSAHTMATGLRAFENALLAADTGPRPPVAPGQAQLWSLALWDAYNRMPDPAEGVMNEAPEACIANLVAEIAATSPPAAPGQPVLPDIVAVALGQPLQVSPTAGCPWPSGALNMGAKAAFRAVAHMGNLGLKLGVGGE